VACFKVAFLRWSRERKSKTTKHLARVARSRALGLLLYLLRDQVQ
jgi:hypothetical protein